MGTAASLGKVGAPSSGRQEWDSLLIFSHKSTHPHLPRQATAMHSDLQQGWPLIPFGSVGVTGPAGQ